MGCLPDLLLFWALCLTGPKLYTVEAGCRPGNPAECSKVPFVPGHNLGGEGFDITTLERKGAYVIKIDDLGEGSKTCRLCKNSLNGYVYQKIPDEVADWRVHYNCRNRLTSNVHESSTSLKQSLSSAVSDDWKVDLSVSDPLSIAKMGVAVAGSNSRMSEFASKKSASSRYSFISQEMSCTYYRYRVKECPKVTEEFNRMFHSLPRNYGPSTKDAFRQFISIYGTHYIRQVHLGGRLKDVTAVKTCEVAMKGLTNSEVKDCLGVEVNMGVRYKVKTDVGTSYRQCQQEARRKLGTARFSEQFSERISEVIGGVGEKDADLLFPAANGGNRQKSIQEWRENLKRSPDVVSYSLAPLHRLKCPRGQVAEHLKKAIVEYILERQGGTQCPRCPKGGTLRPGGQCVCGCPSSAFMSSDCCPLKTRVAELTVTVIRGTELRGDYFLGASDAFVWVEVTGKNSIRTPTINNNNNPRWDYEMQFGSVILVGNVDLKLVVKDQDWFLSRWIGECKLALNEATSGYVHKTCGLRHGYISYRYKLECAPGLRGSQCNEFHNPTASGLLRGSVPSNATGDF